MPRKKRFPPEADTEPTLRRSKVSDTRNSGPAPKSKRAASEAPTLPPPPNPATSPPSRRKPQGGDRTSGMRARKPAHPAATVDEVTADMSRDPRREADDDPDE